MGRQSLKRLLCRGTKGKKLTAAQVTDILGSIHEEAPTRLDIDNVGDGCSIIIEGVLDMEDFTARLNRKIEETT